MDFQSKNKIIIVEDNLLIATETNKRLLNAGYEVIGIFEAGEDLITQIEKLEPDLILMDIMLKGRMSGIDTTKQILKKCDVPIIYLTAYTDKETLNRARETGPFAYLVKPVSKEDLLVNIEMALYNHRAKKQDQSREVITSSLQYLDDAVITTDPDGIVRYLNPAAESLLGTIYKQELGRNIETTLFSRIDLVDAADFIYKDKLSTLRKKFAHNVIVKRGNSKHQDARLKISPVTNVNKEITGIVYILVLLENKENVKLLKESEERFRGVLENIQLSAIMIDEEGKVFFCNDYFLSLSGWDYNEVTGLNWFDNFQTNIPGTVGELPDRGSMPSNLPQNSLSYLKVKNGAKRFVNWNNIPIRDSKEKIIGYTMIGEDVTEKINNENKLKNHQSHLETIVKERTHDLQQLNKQLHNEIIKHKEVAEENKSNINFLSTLIETAPSPIFIKNTQKKYINCNRAFEDAFGLKRKDVIGNTEDFFLPEDTSRKVNNIEDDLLNNGGEKVYDFQLVNPMGEIKEFIITKSVFLKADGEIGGIIAIAMDVTSLKKLEKDLESALKKEKELNELKSRFISTTSHEFRTPLTSIITSADLLEMFGQKWDGEKFKLHLNRIQNAVNKMSDLLEDVLLVNRAESDSIKFSPQLGNFRLFLSELMEEVITNDSSNHLIILEYLTEQNEFYFDTKLLRQIIMNLASNAVKYSPKNSEVKVIVQEENENILLHVIDSGIGIPAKDQPHLFEPFHRAENIGNVSGTGLGLSIVMKAVELHKGVITFASELGKGSEFIVKLPILKELDVQNTIN
ncbi:MAG: PAS domain S-box protein [Bacteroidetes bacterium]|nr:PAS domain S-box protein [Bacteroidota bacterium]